MRIWTKVTMVWDGTEYVTVPEESESHEYEGPVAQCGKGGGGGPSSDPRIGEAALKQAETGQEYLDFVKGAYTDQKPMLDRLNELGFKVSTKQFEEFGKASERADELYGRQKGLYFPLEDKYAKEVGEYGGEQDQTQQAGQAAADVRQQFDLADQNRGQALARYGLNPADMDGTQANLDMQRAASTAKAQTDARTQARLRGIALRQDAVQIGRHQQAGANAASQMANQSAGSAIATPAAAIGTSNQATAAVGQGYQGAMQGFGSSGSLYGTASGQNITSWAANRNAQAQETAGYGQAAGAAAGAYLGYLAFAASSRKLKRDVKPVTDEEGLKAVRKMPVKRWRYKDGVEDGGAAEHTSPMAEDVQAAGRPGQGEVIALNDQLGVLLASVRALDKRIDKVEGRKAA